MEAYFNADTFPSSYFVVDRNRTMHFVANEMAANSDWPLIVFVHGAPGNWMASAQFLADTDIKAVANMAAIDRLGYNQSEKGQWETSLETQAALLHAAIVRLDPAGQVILVGHSFGGPVITRYAMDFPNDVDHLLILAGSVDPELEVTKWFQNVANWRLVRPFIPSALDVTNQEILTLKSELENMMPLWDQITANTIVIQGMQDDLVPYGNAVFIKDRLPEANVIFLEDQNHFLPWNEYDLVKQTLLDLVNDV